MYEIVLLFKISISLFSIIPLIILCGKKKSKGKTLPKQDCPPPKPDPPKSVQSVAQETPKSNMGGNSKQEKPNNEMSINAAFEMNKGEQSTTASVCV